jgi:tetratricopeptide (TPR) repeat protein
MILRWLARAGLVGLLAWQGFEAVRISLYHRQFAAGVRAYASEDWRLAGERFDAARALRDADPLLWTWLGDASRPAFDAVRASGAPDAEARSWLERAWIGYAGAVVRSPMDTWSWTGIAEVLLREAEWEDERRGVDLTAIGRRAEGILDSRRAAALAAALLAVKLRPSGYQELDALAATYEQVGLEDEARETLTASARMMPAPSFHGWGSGKRLTPEAYERVLAALSDGASRVPVYDRSLVNLEIGAFARRQQDLRAALAFLEAAGRSALTVYERYQADSEGARVLAELGRDREALTLLERAHTAGLDEGDILVRLGTIEERLGKYDEACRDLQLALQRVPGSALRLLAARACQSAADTAAAERILRDGFVLPTDDMVMARALVDFYRATGRARSADGLVATWSERFPGRKEFTAWLEEGAVSSSP